jgi:hydroxymethylbilane synthase
MALRARFPQLQIAAVRGNVGTRLTKLDRGDFDALVMAVAGLQRLGLAERIAQILAPEVFLPAPGQGALAIEIRSGDNAVRTRVHALEHAPTRAAVTAERAVSRGLGGSCEFPLAAYAQITQEQLHLRAWAGNAARGEMMEGQGSGPLTQAEAIGLRLVDELKARGVERLLRGG